MSNDNNDSPFTVTETLASRYNPEQIEMIRQRVLAARAAKQAQAQSRPVDPAVAAKREEVLRQRQERQALRAQKKAEREARQAEFIPHIGRVVRAAANLPELSDEAAAVFSQLAQLSPADKACVASHLAHALRENAILTSLTSTSLKVDQKVTITGGDPKYLGLTGFVTEVRKIRCFVDIGVEKPLYLFISDCTPVNETE